MLRVMMLAMLLVTAPIWGGLAMAHPHSSVAVHCPDHAAPPPGPAADPNSSDCQLACLIQSAAPAVSLRGWLRPPGSTTATVLWPPAQVSPDRLSWPPPLRPPRA